MVKNNYEKATGRVGFRERARKINIRRRVISDITDLSGVSVMVTGATSYIGYPLCQDLVNNGYKVFGTSRVKEHALTVPVVKYASMDIDNDTDWDIFFRKNRVPDVIIHLDEISTTKNKKDSFLYKKVNRDGTANLAAIAAKFGVKHFIYLSSIKVNGECSPKGRKFSVSDTPDPKNAYAISKWEAEETIKTICLASGMDYTIFRTPVIYGANATGPLLELLKEINKGVKIPYVDENNIRNLLYSRNLSSAIMFAMFNQKAKNKIFMIKDPENFRVTEIIYRLAELMDKKVRMIKVPLSGLKIASYMNLSSHNWLSNRMEIDDSAIIKAGFKPIYSTFTGFSEMIEWFLIANKDEAKIEKKRRFFIG